MNGSGLKSATVALALVGLLPLLVARPSYAGDDIRVGISEHEPSSGHEVLRLLANAGGGSCGRGRPHVNSSHFRGIITCTPILAVRRRASAIQSALPASFIASTDGASHPKAIRHGRPASQRSPEMVCSSPSPAPRRHWHRQFLALLPQIVTAAKIAFRHLKPEARAEMVQKVVCNAMQAFVRLVQLKKADIAYAAPLANFGIRQALDGRKVGGHLNCLDISSECCQRLKSLVVERLGRRDKDEENAWCEVLVEDRHAGPAETAMARLDMDSW